MNHDDSMAQEILDLLKTGENLIDPWEVDDFLRLLDKEGELA